MTLQAYCAALTWILWFNLSQGLVLSDHHNYSSNLTSFLHFAPTQHTITSPIHPIHIVMATEIYLRGLAYSHGQFSSYEPRVWSCYQICQPLTFVTVFPGLIYCMIKPKVILLVFVSGKIVLMGKVSFTFFIYLLSVCKALTTQVDAVAHSTFRALCL